jgi:tetratricopeptide (TPR) repeat protein
MISQQISDRRQVGIMLNNLARIYEDKGDYPAAQKQYEEALIIAKKIGNKDGEACTSTPRLKYRYAFNGSPSNVHL